MQVVRLATRGDALRTSADVRNCDNVNASVSSTGGKFIGVGYTVNSSTSANLRPETRYTVHIDTAATPHYISKCSVQVSPREK